MLLGLATAACAWHSQLHGGPLPRQTSRSSNSRVNCCEAEKRLVPVTGQSWLDEIFDTPSERAERKRLTQENMAKWGKILSARDTFDDSLLDEEAQAPAAEMKTIAGVPADWALVGASGVTLLACAAAASRSGSPTMGFADWGKGPKVATASHILVSTQTLKPAD